MADPTKRDRPGENGAANSHNVGTATDHSLTEMDRPAARREFQPMPDLPAEDYEALRDHIAEHGILHPVVVDQHGRILDGHHRTAIARELGIDRPVVVREVADDDQAMDIAVSLNCLGRQMSQEQKRAVITSELIRRPGDSDRAIARRVGCSPTTVGTVRADRRAEAEERAEASRRAMSTAAKDTIFAAVDLVLAGADLDGLIERARAVSEAADTEIRRLGEAAFTADEHAEILIDYYVYTCMANDLGDIAEALAASGWTQESMPRKLPVDELTSLIEGLFPVSRLDTREPVGGGAR